MKGLSPGEGVNPKGLQDGLNSMPFTALEQG